MSNLKLFTLSLMFSPALAYAQFAPDWLVAEGIHSVQWHVLGDPQSLTVVPLGETGSLRLAFDDFYQSTTPFNYTWQHCNRDWQPSGLNHSEAIEGFMESQLPDGILSFNTYQPYSHMSTILPHSDCMPRVSGNYYLIIFGESQMDTLLKLPAVFVNQKTQLSGGIHRTSLMGLRQSHQEIDMIVDMRDISVLNPFKDVALSIIQNRNWRSTKQLAPRYLRNGVMDIDHDDGSNCFPGGNHFRYIDNKNLPVPSLRVSRYELNERWVAFVDEEIARGILYPTHQQDGQGVFVPRKQGSDDEGIEADYLWMDLFLKDNEGKGHRQLHVLGDFNAYQPHLDNQLLYDEIEQAYRGRIMVKQGYLEYLIADESRSSTDESSQWSADKIQWSEGNHWETNNRYTVIVYLRSWGARHDEAMGMTTLDSRNAMGLKALELRVGNP